ncbi:MAG: DUF1211 domain-containing protein, partial [Flavisolibacter sp.]|nr:DUF1211 domain-containing protein [Flavisolibacter sp.]
KSKFIGFFFSFLFIASVWFSHNQLFKLFDKIDNAMLWFNNFLLLIVCFIPFPTALIGEYPHNPVGIILLGGIWTLVPLCIYLIGSRALHKKHVHSHVDIKRYLQLRRLTLLYVFLAAVPLLFAWRLPQVAFYIYLVMMVISIIAGFMVKVVED